MPGSTPNNARPWLAPLCLFVLVAGYVWLWHNRFLGATSNVWHFLYGKQILAGKVPYRDFYMYVPPLHPLKFTALIALFGDVLLPARILAVFERALTAVLLYFWLLPAARNSTSVAFLVSLTTAVVFCGDPADALSLHHHDSVLLALVAALAASRSIRQLDARCAALSGLAAGLSFLAKHTTGAGVTAVLFAGLVFATGRPRIGAAYLAGWTVPIAATLAWLWRNQALWDFADQVFLRGPSSKGPIWQVLSRPLTATFANPWYIACALIAILVTGAAAWGASRRDRARSSQPFAPASSAYSSRTVPYAIPVATVCLIAAVSLGWSSIVLFRSAQMIAVYAALFGCLAIFVLDTKAWRTVDPQRWLMSAVSFAVVYMLSLSWPAYEPMALPALAFLLALWFAHGGGRLAVATCVFLLFAAAALKMERPFQWFGWQDVPVRQATVAPTLPALQGFRLGADANQFLEDATRIIQQNSGPNDTLYIFPHLPVLYVLTGRQPMTFAYVHWWDVAPDHVCRADAERLRRMPPKVIARMDFTEAEIERQEGDFRAKGQSGQRDLLKAIEDLHYRPVATLKAPGGTNTVTILVR